VAANLVEVTYGFTNRTPDMKLSRGAYKWLLEQMKRAPNNPKP
jgi:nicotinate phosphoribosyltransferase